MEIKKKLLHQNQKRVVLKNQKSLRKQVINNQNQLNQKANMVVHEKVLVEKVEEKISLSLVLQLNQINQHHQNQRLREY